MIGLLLISLVLPLLPTAFIRVEAAGAASGNAESVCRGTIVDPDLPCVAEFDLDGDSANRPVDMHIDAKRRRLIATGTSSETFNGAVWVLDISEVSGPRQVERFDLPFLGGPLAVDESSERAFVVPDRVDTTCGSLAGVVTECQAGQGRLIDISVVSLRGDFAPSSVGFPESLRGHIPVGLAYDTDRDVLYVLSVVERGNRTSVGVAIDAFDASKLEAAARTGAADAGEALIWPQSYERLGGCTDLVGNSSGSFLGLGRTGDLLYFGCKGTETPEAAGVRSQRLTQSGIIVVDMMSGWDPSDRSPRDQEDFITEFHAFAGSLAFNAAGGNQAAEQMYLLTSGLSQERVYVFDARHRAWTGSRPLGRANIRGIASDPRTGRIYPLQQEPTVFLVDAALVPMPQGTSVTLGMKYQSSLNAAFDPLTRRLYLPGNVEDPETQEKPISSLRVYEDRTPPAPLPPPDANPDERTHDIDPATAEQVTHTAIASGYGARQLFVGGLSNSQAATFNDNSLVKGSRAEVEGGQREALFGFVSDVEVSGDQNRGVAKANAVGINLGAATESDLRAKSPQQVPRSHDELDSLFPDFFNEDEDFSEGHDQFDEGVEPLDDGLDSGLEPFDQGIQENFQPIPEELQDRENGADEFVPSTCNLPATDHDTDGNRASGVHCEPRGETRAHAASSGHAEGSPVSVGFASTRVESALAPGSGAVNRVVSVARNIEVVVPQLGALAIGEVRSVAESWAHGRPGTADSTYTVSINGVKISDPAGEIVFACGFDTSSVSTDEGDGESASTQPDDPGGKCDSTAVVRAINERFALVLQAKAPQRDVRPLITGSPGGAQALVTKDELAVVSDSNTNFDDREEVVGLELVLYNDASRPSRLIAQFAGVRAESRFLIGQPARRVTADPRVAAPPDPTAHLDIALVDVTGAPLADGRFEVRTDLDKDGVLGIGDGLEPGNSCTTSGDGRGNCQFALDPGSYVIHQAAAPEGFEPTDDLPLELPPGFDAEVTFTNLHVSDAPVVLAEDVGRARPVVQIAPQAGDTVGVLERLFGVPADVLDFLRRNPWQAFLFGLVWLIVGSPIYLALRRRDLLSIRRTL